MSWIDAMRVYNAGMPSWCIPRKGTQPYEIVMKIRRGETAETPKQIIDRLERKTIGKGKKEEKKSMSISLEEPKPTTIREKFSGQKKSLNL